MKRRRGNGGSNSGRKLAFLAGILVGGLVGAATMFLLAPRSGEKSRAQIHKESEKMRAKATAAMDDVVTVAGDKAQWVTDGMQQGVDGLQQKAQEMFVDG